MLRKKCESENLDKVKNKVLKYGISVGMAILLLYFSFRGVKWEEFFGSLRNCRWEWIAFAMIAGVLSFWLRALRWRELLLPIDRFTTLKTSFNAINIGYLANLVLPRVGEFVRCGVISGHSSVNADNKRLASYDKVLGTVVLERSWDVVTMLLLVILFAVSLWGRFGGFFIERIFTPLSSRFDSGLWWVAVIAVAICLLLIWLVWHFCEKSMALRSLSKFINGIGQGVSSCMKMKKAWLFPTYTLFIWLTYWFMSYAVLMAVKGMDTSSLTTEMADAVAKLASLGALDALFLMLAGSISSLVPVPGGFGAFHYIVAAALLSVYDVPFSMGIVFATLSHESQMLTQLVCGCCSYVSESMSLVRK